MIEKGIKDDDYIGHATIRYNDIEVGLSSQKGNTPLKNHYMITSFERDEKVLRELETNGTLSNDYRDGINYSISNLEPNLIQKSLTSQEDLLKTQENTQNTQDNDTILRTFILDTPKRYVRSHVRNADIIHSFIQPNRTAKSDDALSTVVVYGENITKKLLTSQENLPKTRENLFITET
ncbi:hypothetical protein HPSH417_04290 [Helicobacter pylori Shi417]|nr:hypothetical protein HPSH417_04290 [Helicobacter pylori Shi417]